LKVDIARIIGFQQERFGIGLNDGSGQPVAILQSNLIGHGSRRAETQQHT
jgi:hypothetical protein